MKAAFVLLDELVYSIKILVTFTKIVLLCYVVSILHVITL